MERSFKKEVDALRLGDGEIFRGEGILAVTKALLQSGVSYVGGYQGAPVSHLLDVMVDAEDLLTDLGVHVETCTNEAAAAAMLGASINYPLRGAVTWKSIVGTNVAADALSNLASPGVIGGALIVLGEDYGEGASVIQERSYAYAMKSSIWLLDPRPDLPTIVHMVEKGFELSEATHAPVMLDLRVRACHVTGEFIAKDNKRGAYSGVHRLNGPPRFEYGRLAHPPVIFTQERLKIEERLPAAQKFIREQKLNEFIPGDLDDVGIIVLGGLTNELAARAGAARSCRSLRRLAHPDLRAQRRLSAGAGGSEGFLRRQTRGAGGRGRLAGICRAADQRHAAQRRHRYARARQGVPAAQRRLQRPRSCCAASPPSCKADAAGRHRCRRHCRAGRRIRSRTSPAVDRYRRRYPAAAAEFLHRLSGAAGVRRDQARAARDSARPISAPISAATRSRPLRRSRSAIRSSATACRSPAPPPSAPNMERRPISIMGDGGFWHNGLITGVASNMFNKGDGVLIVMQNGYASATGQQYLPSSEANRSGTPTGISIEKTVRSLGVTWLRTVRTYSVAKMVATLKEAMRTAERGLKVIIADGECMLARQRRIRAEDAEKLKRGERVVKTRYGVDDEICTGDHSCIRLSGCPSLTVKPNPDPLRTDPVAAVIESCVGCGLCGEVAHAAVLCPSFYQHRCRQQSELVGPHAARMRSTVIGWLRGSFSLSRRRVGPASEARSSPAP